MKLYTTSAILWGKALNQHNFRIEKFASMKAWGKNLMDCHYYAIIALINFWTFS
jgi:hypothetical protein